MTLAKYVIKTVEKNGPMTARAVIKAYRRTKDGKKSKSSDAVLETKARKTLKTSASIATTAAGTALGMELYRFIHPPSSSSSFSSSSSSSSSSSTAENSEVAKKTTIEEKNLEGEVQGEENTEGLGEENTEGQREENTEGELKENEEEEDWTTPAPGCMFS